MRVVPHGGQNGALRLLGNFGATALNRHAVFA